MEHKTENGNTMKGKQVKRGCENCRLKCSQRLTEVMREKIYKGFWSIGNRDLQRNWIREKIIVKDVATDDSGENDFQSVKFSEIFFHSRR